MVAGGGGEGQKENNKKKSAVTGSKRSFICATFQSNLCGHKWPLCCFQTASPRASSLPASIPSLWRLLPWNHASPFRVGFPLLPLVLDIPTCSHCSRQVGFCLLVCFITNRIYTQLYCVPVSRHVPCIDWCSNVHNFPFISEVWFLSQYK